jgi:hypothetical protein
MPLPDLTRRIMADLVAGVQPYRTLAWRLLSTFEVRLALQVLISGRRSLGAP